MEKIPNLIDTSALRQHRNRAHRNPALFLHDDAASELHERLLEVNRTFTDAVIVSDFRAPWQDVLPSARIIPHDDALNLPEGGHDLIVHAMGLHWSNDPVGQMVQCARALRPDGLFLAVCFGGQTLNELRASLAEAEIAVTGGLSPRVLPMGEIRDLGALLGRVGLALPVADNVSRKVTYADPVALMHDLRAMGETNALETRIRHFTRRAIIANAVGHYTSAFSEPDGRIRATFDMIWLTGWKPAPNQQKPLRPGSAAHRLAEALGTKEIPAGGNAGE